MTTSVALCTFNGEKYLEEQMESILSQKVPVNEIVICDDGSTDKTSSILKNYQKQFPDVIRLFFNEENLGYVSNFEKALTLCTKDLVFLCDQDDIWHPEKAGTIIQYFAENTEIGLVAHDLELIGSYEGKQTFWELKNFRNNTQKISSENLLKNILLNGNVFPGMTLTIRKKLLLTYLPLQKIDSTIIHDYELIIKALRDDKFGVINKVLGGYRQHDQQSIGFKEKETTSKNGITEIHLLSQQYLRIKNYTEVFNLNQNIASDFQKEVKVKYSLFLKGFSLPKRIFIHLKNKYYYKILHF